MKKISFSILILFLASTQSFLPTQSCRPLNWYTASNIRSLTNWQIQHFNANTSKNFVEFKKSIESIKSNDVWNETLKWPVYLHFLLPYEVKVHLQTLDIRGMNQMEFQPVRVASNETLLFSLNHPDILQADMLFKVTLKRNFFLFFPQSPSHHYFHVTSKCHHLSAKVFLQTIIYECSGDWMKFLSCRFNSAVSYLKTIFWTTNKQEELLGRIKDANVQDIHLNCSDIKSYVRPLDKDAETLPPTLVQPIINGIIHAVEMNGELYKNLMQQVEKNSINFLNSKIDNERIHMNKMCH